jgi:hypothetical protein
MADSLIDFVSQVTAVSLWIHNCKIHHFFMLILMIFMDVFSSWIHKGISWNCGFFTMQIVDFKSRGFILSSEAEADESAQIQCVVPHPWSNCV